MKIKEFSKLCGCNPKTLRYYDTEGLLKPAQIDEDTGYRLYAAEQALEYIRIKSLQKAGFTISEIRDLLNKSDDEIYRALELRIAETEKRLLEMKEIQSAYRSEITEMKNRILALKKMVSDSVCFFDSSEEFGMSQAEYDMATGRLKSLLDNIIRDEKLKDVDIIDNKGSEKAYLESCLSNPAYTTMYEKHGWRFFKDFYCELPEINENDGYLFLFKVIPEKGNQYIYAISVISLMLDRFGDYPRIGCTVTDSDDSLNHFWLVRYT